MSVQRETNDELHRRSLHGSIEAFVREMVESRFDAANAVRAMAEASDGDFYLYGGALRRALLGNRLAGDLDLIIPNGDLRVWDRFDALGVPFSLNSHSHRRYQWNYLTIDVFHPSDFFGGFPDIEGVLRFCDLRINSLALHWGTGEIIDPFRLAHCPPPQDPGINWAHWRHRRVAHAVVLAIRLTKTMFEAPGLALPAADIEQLKCEVVPQIKALDWTLVHQRFPGGKEQFLQVFETTVLSRVIEGRAHLRAQDVHHLSGVFR